MCVRCSPVSVCLFVISLCFNEAAEGIHILAQKLHILHCLGKEFGYLDYEPEGPIPRGRPKRTWREVVEKDCQAHKLNTEDTVNRSRWRKLIRDV